MNVHAREGISKRKREEGEKKKMREREISRHGVYLNTRPLIRERTREEGTGAIFLLRRQVIENKGGQ